jgi:hypothetical protein
VKRLPLQLLPNQPGIDELVAQILGERARIALVAHYSRRDQDQELRALSRIRLAGNEAAEYGNILEDRDPGIALLVIVTDQTGHPDRLPVLHRNTRPKQPLVEGRRVDVSG